MFETMSTNLFIVLIQIFRYHRFVTSQRFLQQRRTLISANINANYELAKITYLEVGLSIASDSKRRLLNVIDEVVESTRKRQTTSVGDRVSMKG